MNSHILTAFICKYMKETKEKEFKVLTLFILYYNDM